MTTLHSTRVALAIASITALAIACSSGGSTTNDAGTEGGPTMDSSAEASSSDAAADAPLGPGAAYLCTSSGKDAWQTYGATAFVAVNQSIFANVEAQIADAGTTNLGTSFTLIGSGTPPSTTDNLATFEGRLAAFLVWAYGGPSEITYTDGKMYSGLINMTAAHTGLNITMDQYNYFIANIVVPALSTNGVPMGDITSCFAPVVTNATFVASIVGH